MYKIQDKATYEGIQYKIKKLVKVYATCEGMHYMIKQLVKESNIIS